MKVIYKKGKIIYKEIQDEHSFDGILDPLSKILECSYEVKDHGKTIVISGDEHSLSEYINEYL